RIASLYELLKIRFHNLGNLLVVRGPGIHAIRPQIAERVLDFRGMHRTARTRTRTGIEIVINWLPTRRRMDVEPLPRRVADEPIAGQVGQRLHGLVRTTRWIELRCLARPLAEYACQHCASRVGRRWLGRERSPRRLFGVPSRE